MSLKSGLKRFSKKYLRPVGNFVKRNAPLILGALAEVNPLARMINAGYNSVSKMANGQLAGMQYTMGTQGESQAPGASVGSAPDLATVTERYRRKRRGK